MTRSASRRPRALITGASRGLGRTLAQFLAGQGFDLIVTSRGRSELDSAASELRSFGGNVMSCAGDVADERHRSTLRDLVRDTGRLDLLVNNASELGPSPLLPLDRYPLSEFEKVFRVNVVGPIGLVQLLLPFLEQSGGQVVNISSDAATAGYPGWGGYGASKAALDLVSLTLAHELEERGVSVVAVDPGDLRTALHQAAFYGEDISDRPLPEVTLPFWAWLLSRPRALVSGQRYRAQDDRWEVPA